MPKYISGRSKKTPQSALPADRYRYLSVGDSEPNLGDTPTDQGSPNLPSGQQYIVVGFRDRPGERFWIPNQGGIIPGSLSVFEENALVGGLSSTTQLNFVGNAITATGITGPPPGVAVTITVAPPGLDNSVLFKNSGDFATDTRFTFNSGLFAAGDRITVGTGGTVITTTGIGSVGIGTTTPTQKLHLDGDFRITGTIYDSLNQPGNQGDLLIKGADENLIWVNQNAVTSGAGGTIGQIQFHSTAGVVDGADNFYFDFNNNRVGIGSTQPTQLLDVLGVSLFTGDVNFIGDNYNLLWDKSQDSLEFEDETKITFGNGRDLQIFHTDSLSSQTDSNGDSIVDGRTSLIEERGSGGLIFKSNGGDGPGAYQFFDQNWQPLLKLHGGNNARALLFHDGIERIETTGYGVTINGGLVVSGIATIQTLNLQNLSVPGISTLGNVVVGTNTISTKPGTGNLILDSDGIVQVNDPLYISGSTESTSKDVGSIITEGGIGVEKSVSIGLNLNVGGAVSFTGPSVGIAVTLAGAGGITTTGGDLYVNGNVLPSHNATSNNDPSGKDIGASNANWRRVYAQEFVGAFIGIADTATNLAGGAAGSIPYQSAPDTTVFLAEPDADNKVLSYNNTSDAPTWIDLDKIQEGNTKAEVVDTGNNGYFTVETEGTEKFRIDNNGSVNFYDGGTQYYGSISKNSSGSFELLGYTNLDLFADGTRISIDQIGVGINSTQPTAELDVNGKVALGSSVYDSNGNTGSNQQILSSAPGIGVSWTSIQDIITTPDKIQEDNTSAEVVDTGTNGHFKVLTEGTERFRIGPAGIATFFGNGTATITSPSDLNLNANTVAISTDITIGAKIGLGNPVDYGSPGEVLTSNGSSSAPTWQGLSGVVQDKIQEGNTSAEVVDTGTDGHFKVLTEGTERFRITPNGRVGIGTDNPYTALHIHHPDSILAIENSGTSGIGVTLLTIGQSGYEDLIIKHRSGNDSSYAEVETMRISTNGIRIRNTNYAASAQADELIIGDTDNNNNRGLTIVSGYQKSSSIYFGDNSNNASGSINYSHLLDALQIATNGSERLRIGSAGQIGLGGANYGSATQVLTSNGSNAAPTWEPIPGASIPDKIQEDNTSAEVVDTGTDGHFKVLTEGTERFRIGPAGIATFTADITAGSGTPGQINIDPTTSTSNGRIRYSGTKTFMIEGGSSFDNKIEIHGHQNSLNILCEGQGETELYFNGNKKLATTGAGITVTGISSASEGFDFGVNSSGTPVTTNSVKTLNFSGTNNTITYDASTKTVDIDIDSGSGGGVVQDKIEEDNTSAEVVDTGTDGHFKVLTEGTERFRIGPAGITTVVGTAKFADNTVTIEKISSTEGVIDSGINGGTLFICGGQPAAGKVKIQGTRSSAYNNIICNAVGSPGSTELHFAATGGTNGKKLETTGYGITVTGISSATEGFDFEVQSSGTPVTTNSVKILNFSGTNNTITYDASTKTVDIDIDSGSGGGGVQDKIQEDNTSAEVVDTGTNGHFKVLTEGTERFRIGPAGIATFNNDLNVIGVMTAISGAGITVTGISSATEGFDFGVNSSGTPVTTGSVKTLNFSGTNNTITYDASTKTVDIDIDSGSGSGGGTVFSGTFTASAGSPSTLNTYAYDSAELVFEYTVFVKNGSDYQSQKLLVMRDGTTVHSTQYGVMYSNNPLVELDATISGSNLLLRATPETGVNGSTTYRLKREAV